MKLRDSINQAAKLQLTAAFPLMVMVMQGWIRELKLGAQQTHIYPVDFGCHIHIIWESFRVILLTVQ